MDIKKIADQVVKQMDGKLKHIYFVACGGSLVDMYVSDYFIKSESTIIESGWYTSNEFVHAAPKKLGKNSIVILCSHSGSTPETVQAGRVAKEAGALTIGFTYNSEAELLKVSDWSYLYEWGNEKEVKNNPMALILNLTVRIMNSIEGYKYFNDFVSGMDRINIIVSSAEDQVQTRVQTFAEKYSDEKLFYIVGSGASFGHVYGFSICSLMEMQWLNASAIHSGEFFHGPFEVTDKETPFVLIMSEGRTRVLDERVKQFLDKYGSKIEVVDAKELGLGTIEGPVVEYFNPILFYSVLSQYREALSEVRSHPLDVRRYMGKVDY